MRKYEPYLLDESEEAAHEMEKMLAFPTDGTLCKTSVESTKEEIADKLVMYEVISGIHSTICNLMQIDNISMNTCYYFSFSVIHKQDGRIQYESESPRLSRDKLMGIKTHDMANMLIEFFLDRDSWSKDVLTSLALSDGNGNWL